MHLTRERKPRGYWTRERVLVDARRHTYQAEWIRASSGAFTVARRNGWLQEACAHMTSPKIPMGYWTLETLKADARNYTTRAAWKKASQSSYSTAVQQGLLKECCAHMDRLRKPDGYWTSARCIESASRFDTVAEWSLAEPAAYDAAKRHGWIALATKHMVRVFSHGERTLYMLLLQHDIKFEYQKRFEGLRDKKPLPFDFYLPDFGLVIEYQGRQHFAASKSSMFRRELSAIQRRDAQKKAFADRSGLSYLQINDERVDGIEAAVLSRLHEIAERRGIDLQLRKRALTAVEKIRVAHLGKWTKEAVLADARRFRTLPEWSKCGNAACQIAYRNGWIAEATAHMTTTQKPKNYWSKERVVESARRYSARMQWFEAEQAAYTTAVKRGWLKEATAHMTLVRNAVKRPKDQLTKDALLRDARQYRTLKEWRTASRRSYRYTRDRGWLDEASAHMVGG